MRRLARTVGERMGCKRNCVAKGNRMVSGAVYSCEKLGVQQPFINNSAISLLANINPLLQGISTSKYMDHSLWGRRRLTK
jgi:hypothetical protein